MADTAAKERIVARISSHSAISQKKEKRYRLQLMKHTHWSFCGPDGSSLSFLLHSSPNCGTILRHTNRVPCRTAPAAWFGIRMRVLYDGLAVNQVRWGTKQP